MSEYDYYRKYPTRGSYTAYKERLNFAYTNFNTLVLEQFGGNIEWLKQTDFDFYFTRILNRYAEEEILYEEAENELRNIIRDKLQQQYQQQQFQQQQQQQFRQQQKYKSIVSFLENAINQKLAELEWNREEFLDYIGEEYRPSLNNNADQIALGGENEFQVRNQLLEKIEADYKDYKVIQELEKVEGATKFKKFREDFKEAFPGQRFELNFYEKYIQRYKETLSNLEELIEKKVNDLGWNMKDFLAYSDKNYRPGLYDATNQIVTLQVNPIVKKEFITNNIEVVYSRYKEEKEGEVEGEAAGSFSPKKFREEFEKANPGQRFEESFYEEYIQNYKDALSHIDESIKKKIEGLGMTMEFVGESYPKNLYPIVNEIALGKASLFDVTENLLTQLVNAYEQQEKEEEGVQFTRQPSGSDYGKDTYVRRGAEDREELLQLSEKLGGTDEGLKSVLRVRTQKGIYDPTIPHTWSHAPGGDMELGKKEEYWRQNPGLKYARRQDSVENDPVYASSDVDVRQDVNVVIYAHGAVIKGTNLTIPDNVKLYSPLKCAGQTLLSVHFSDPTSPQLKNTERRLMLRSYCPGDPEFRKKYVLTEFDRIPDMVFNTDTEQLSLELKSGIYECTGRSRLAYGGKEPLVKFELGSTYSLSGIIEELKEYYKSKGRQFRNLNIILRTCMTNVEQ